MSPCNMYMCISLLYMYVFLSVYVCIRGWLCVRMYMCIRVCRTYLFRRYVRRSFLSRSVNVALSSLAKTLIAGENTSVRPCTLRPSVTHTG